jgi:hypothetical protein
MWLVAGMLASNLNTPAEVFLTNNIARPLRYTPIGEDFVITNGSEFFNRPLYGSRSPFRVDAGDKPEFSLYLPGRGGNLRLGLKTPLGMKWLNDADKIVARYRPGSMVYDIKDALLMDNRELHLTVLPLSTSRGFIVRAELNSAWMPIELLWAFGGANGMKGQRNGDIGCEREPVGSFFQLAPEQCAGSKISLRTNAFTLNDKAGTIVGAMSAGSQLALGDANLWSHPEKLFIAQAGPPIVPLVTGRIAMPATEPVYLALQQVTDDAQIITTELLPALFKQAEEQRRTLAERVVVETPDPFVNAAAGALNVAANTVWDDRQEAFLHGGVAWRMRLLGWRVSYVGDELGWHERTAQHFAGFAANQNTNPVTELIPGPEANANFSRNENALHSNGDLTKTHYDMNLVGVDVFFRHLLWTGDLDYARKMWPVIQRHLAWERRLFRREFGSEKLPLYEAYCCIWASDDLAYNGGGATHSSAYNLYHNRMAARVAKLIGEDPKPYEHEAELIAHGMKENLWLADRGWFAEWKDLLGLQLVHPNAAAWTFYHAVDSEAATPMESWQMTRFVDTQIARFPILVGDRQTAIGNAYTMPTTSWMPYTWSLNNVVMAETMHTALGYWQANRADGAFPLFKGALLDSMYLGLCPGNVGMCTWFDANRRESQRDFGDGIGATSRALVEGLFGFQPDLLAGEIKIRPGFPSEWDHARIVHPDFSFTFKRDNLRETFSIETEFAKPQQLRLQIPALRDSITSVLVNGKPASWRMMEESVGIPRIEIIAQAAKKQIVVIEWRGKTPAAPRAEIAIAPKTELHADLEVKILELSDPQNALSHALFDDRSLRGVGTGTPGHRTVFAKVQQGELRWWQPIMLEIRAQRALGSAMDWITPINATFEMVDLTKNFNDRVTRVFLNEYLAPRSRFCSLATPKQGFGSWCHPQENFTVDDSGLRAAAAKSGGKIILPNGVPLATPGLAVARNIAFVSRWENYPAEITVPLAGKSPHAFLLMAGSTSAMQSRFDNGEVIANYVDGSTERLVLENPTTWWPIDQDYYIDDFAFARPEPLPVRVDLATGLIRVLEMNSFKGKGGKVPGGAATVLQLPLDPAKDLKSLTVRALANEVVIGLMSVTLQR